MVNRIRKLRREQELTQTELAEKAGVSRITVARYEANATVPSVDSLSKVATALGTTIDNLISDTEEEGPPC